MVNHIPKEVLPEHEKKNGQFSSKNLKSIGLHYRAEEGIFSFKEYRNLSKEQVDTKMKLTSLLAKIFSPNGLLLPIQVEKRHCLSATRAYRDVAGKCINCNDKLASSLQSKVNIWLKTIAFFGL